MAQRIIQSILSLTILGILLSCNVYAPLESESSEEALLEAAQKCLHDDDIDCAIEKYSALPPGNTKNQKLCTSHLVKSGLTLKAFINVIGSGESNMLAALAQTLAPWDAAKGAAAAAALTHCTDYNNTAAGDLGVLLLTIGNFVDCATRIAKTDLLVATSNDDTACNTPGNGDELINQADIGAADGSIATTGMCTADVTICGTNISGVDSTALDGSGFGGIADSNDALGTAITNEVTNTARQAIFGMVPAVR